MIVNTKHMKKILFVCALVASFTAIGQVEIYEVSDPAIILNGQEYVVEGGVSDVAVFVDLRVKNVSGSDVSVRFRRDRVIGNSAEDQICDNDLCYSCTDTPSYTTPNATTLVDSESMIFKPQFVPEGTPFCAIHDYFIVDQFGFVLDTIRIKFKVGGEDCFLSVPINNTKSLDVYAYPNPTSGKVTFRDAPTGSSVEIVNVLGKSVLKRTIKLTNQSIEISALTRGVYLYTVTLPNGATLPSKKLLVKD